MLTELLGLKMTQATHQIRFGIFHKLLFILVAISIIPLTIIWYIHYHTTTEQLNQNIQQHLEWVSNTLVTHVNDWLEMNYRMLQENAAEPAMKSMNPVEQKPILGLITKEYPWIHSVLVIDPKGKAVSRSDDKPLQDYADRSHVQQILEGAPRGQQVLIGKTTGLPGLALSTAIHGVENRLIGILTASMATILISDQVTNVQIGNTGFSFLLDKQGKVVAHQSMQDASFKKDFSEHPAFLYHSKEGGSNLVYWDDRGKQVIAHVNKTQGGWTLITQQDYDEAFSAVYVANRNAVILLIITLITVFIVTYVLSRRLTRPISQLTKIANEASVANFKVLDSGITATQSTDEIGELARSVERLAVSLRVAIGRLGKKPRSAVNKQ